MNINEYSFTVALPKKKKTSVLSYWNSCDIKMLKPTTGIGSVDKTP